MTPTPAPSVVACPDCRPPVPLETVPQSALPVSFARTCPRCGTTFAFTVEPGDTDARGVRARVFRFTRNPGVLGELRRDGSRVFMPGSRRGPRRLNGGRRGAS